MINFDVSQNPDTGYCPDKGYCALQSVITFVDPHVRTPYGAVSTPLGFMSIKK